MTKKRYRKKQATMGKDGTGGKTYWMYGIHACMAALDNPEREVIRILASQTIAERLELIEGRPHVEMTDIDTLVQLLPLEAVHQGIAVQVHLLDELALDDVMDSGKPIILLDQVTDPHNIGAILRSAAAFDAAAVVVTKHHAPKENAVMAKTACGGMDIIPLISVTNLVAAIEDLKKAGYWVWGLDGDARQTIREAKPDQKTALVLGAEGKGLRRLSAEHCDLMVRLPIHEQMESLNVSNAAAIAMYEIALTSKNS
jgi:23S rRNA (guanosine2251-2'-O)-methyltransferase